MIDLHTHSRFSDGLLEPAALAEAACNAGLSAMALTDHDAVGGIGPLAAAAGPGLRVVPGIELDTDYTPGVLHVLGYFIDPACPALVRELARLRASRETRLKEMLLALARLGVELDEDAVRREAGSGSIGRPHVARALVRSGAVSSADEAFARYLARGRPAWVPRFTHSPEDAIATIRAADGVAVLAHPVTLELGPEPMAGLIARLQASGLAGIETYYPGHTTLIRRRLRRMAARFDLVCTGGSDFHGEMPGRARLGVGHGDLRVPDEALDALAARAPSTSSVARGLGRT